MGPGEPFGVGGPIFGEKNVAHHGWATKKFFHFLRPLNIIQCFEGVKKFPKKNTLKRYSIKKKNNFYGLIWAV